MVVVTIHTFLLTSPRHRTVVAVKGTELPCKNPHKRWKLLFEQRRQQQCTNVRRHVEQK